MKKIAVLFVFALFWISLSAQRNEVADPARKNDQEAKVVHITPESSGVKRGIGYKFLLRRGDEDPGNGLFRFNDDNVSDVRYIYVDNMDIAGEDQTKFYSSWDLTTGATSRGRVTIADANGKVITVFYFKGVFVDGKGFWKLPVEYVSGELPIDGHVYYYVFDRIAQKEENGNPNQPAPVIPVNPVVPVIAVTADTIDVPVIPVTQVAEVVQVNPVVSVNEVVEVKPVVQVIPVKPDTIEKMTDMAIPSRRVIKADPEKPDSLINPGNQVNPARRTRPGNPVSRDSVVALAKKSIPAEPAKPINPVSQANPVTQENPVAQEKPLTQAIPERPATTVNQPKPANPVTQPKPANPVSQPKPAIPVSQPKPVVAEKPVTQEKPAIPVSQPKPSNQVSQTYPANQGNQNYPVPEGSRLPSYQRYTGSSSGIQRKWYRGIIEAGYGLGVGDYGINNFRLNFINGFKIGNSSLGLGIGYRRYFIDNNTAPYLVSKKSEVPVSLDFRTNFSDKKITPYFALGLGGTASADTTLSGKDRLFFTTSGGIWFNMSDRFAVFAGIAYELQKLEFSDTNPYTGNYRKNSNSISLNIGIAF